MEDVRMWLSLGTLLLLLLVPPSSEDPARIKNQDDCLRLFLNETIDEAVLSPCVEPIKQRCVENGTKAEEAACARPIKVLAQQIMRLDPATVFGEWSRFGCIAKTISNRTGVKTFCREMEMVCSETTVADPENGCNRVLQQVDYRDCAKVPSGNYECEITCNRTFWKRIEHNYTFESVCDKHLQLNRRCRGNRKGDNKYCRDLLGIAGYLDPKKFTVEHLLKKNCSSSNFCDLMIRNNIEQSKDMNFIFLLHKQTCVRTKPMPSFCTRMTPACRAMPAYNNSFHCQEIERYHRSLHPATKKTNQMKDDPQWNVNSSLIGIIYFLAAITVQLVVRIKKWIKKLDRIVFFCYSAFQFAYFVNISCFTFILFKDDHPIQEQMYTIAPIVLMFIGQISMFGWFQVFHYANQDTTNAVNWTVTWDRLLSWYLFNALTCLSFPFAALMNWLKLEEQYQLQARFSPVASSLSLALFGSVHVLLTYCLLPEKYTPYDWNLKESTVTADPFEFECRPAVEELGAYDCLLTRLERKVSKDLRVPIYRAKRLPRKVYTDPMLFLLMLNGDDGKATKKLKRRSAATQPTTPSEPATPSGPPPKSPSNPRSASRKRRSSRSPSAKRPRTPSQPPTK